MWFHHVCNLLARSWSAMVAAFGTTTLGFFVWTILSTAIAWFAGIAATWVKLWRRKTSHPFREALNESLLPGKFLASGISLILFVSYTISLIHTTYQDHESLVNRIAALHQTNIQLSQQLEIRKHSIVVGDPVFVNTLYLLQAFNAYRHTMEGKPCVIMVTAPRHNNGMASMVAQFGSSVSGCSTFGPMDSDSDPDVEKRAVAGMVPSKVVFHAGRNDKTAYRLMTPLSDLFQIQRSYEIPSVTERAHIYASAGAYQESFIWLQFGSNVQWNNTQWSEPLPQ